VEVWARAKDGAGGETDRMGRVRISAWCDTGERRNVPGLKHQTDSFIFATNARESGTSMYRYGGVYVLIFVNYGERAHARSRE